MTEANQMFLFQAAAVLLPMIPAVVLFKFLPASGEVSGPLKGLRVKFGGAFAAYLIIFLFLWEGRPADLHHYHYWTVKGIVQTTHAREETDPSLRDVICRIVPPRFEVENDGSFSFDVAMPEDESGNPQFPDLQINLPDYAGATIHLNDQNVGYGSIAVAQKIDAKRRTIHLTSPIVLKSSRTQPAYVAAVAQQAVPENVSR